HTRSTRDWSSDVCSSDLFDIQTETTGVCPALTTCSPPCNKYADVSHGSRHIRDAPKNKLWRYRPSISPNRSIMPFMAWTPSDAKIGRASCREREANTEGD